MRGKVYSPAKYPAFSRITPAYAGKRPDTIAKLKKAGDHPRLCGEKCEVCHMLRRKIGSPPPMRGKAVEQTPETMYQRITPAYAGKRNTATASPVPRKDHPRLCGEKYFNECFLPQH